MQIEKALRLAQKELKDRVERPLFEAEILLAHTLKKERIFLHAHPELELTNEEQEAFFAAIKRRKAFEPIEYITQSVSFYGERFYIERGVLIPRPETELLVDEAAKELRGDERVAEIGVGSGVVSIMLKKRFGSLRIVATDISQKALAVAAKNAQLHGVELELVHTSLLDGVEGEFDMILSNPPYIARSAKLEPNVVEYEPHEALFGGERGDELLRAIIDLFFASSAKILACEMGYDQRPSIEHYLERYGGVQVRFYKDLAGLDRGFVIRKDRK